MSNEVYDVIVIGAGGGGLAAAARLSRGGMKTLLIEKHNKVGGYMTNFKRGDYTFEVSLHNFDGLDEKKGMNYFVFSQLGIIDRVKPVRLEPAYNAVYPGSFFTIPSDPETYKDYLIKEFPLEEAGIKKFFKSMSAMKTALEIMTAVQKKKYLNILTANLKNPFWLKTMAKYSMGSAKKMLDDHFKDEKLKTLIAWLV